MATVYKRGGKSNRTGSWWIQWFDHNGKRQSKSSRTSDKAAAERIAAKYEADAALRRERVIDPTLDAISKQSLRPIAEHVADYEAKMVAANRGGQYVAETIACITKICAAESFTLPTDITADGVIRYAGRLKEAGRSSRTIQAHLTAIKGFVKWLTVHDKLTRDPLAKVKKPNPKADRRRERRMLLPDEWQWLRSVTSTSPERFGMIGAERVLLYETAIQTGLRSNELRSLTRARLYLDADRPYVTCKAGSTKNKKPARQYVRSETAAALRAHAASKSPQARVFGLPGKFDMAAMLRADLADARRAWLKAAKYDAAERERREQTDFLTDKNHDGELIDFHCLRHTCGAWLAMSGRPAQTVKKVMRHSTITLTMDTYGHLFPGEEADAVDGLQDFLAGPPEALAATGTDDATPGPDVWPRKALQKRQQLARETVPTDAMPRDDADGQHEKRESHNPLQIATLDETVRDNTKRRAGDSNPQPLAGHLISSQLGSGEMSGEQGGFEKSAALGAAVGADFDADLALAAWVDLCPLELPAAIRAAVIAMVRAACCR